MGILRWTLIVIDNKKSQQQWDVPEEEIPYRNYAAGDCLIYLAEEAANNVFGRGHRLVFETEAVCFS